MKALIVVDMQKDFMPNGPLPTKDADKIIPIINQLMEKFSLVIATKDWHPKDHIGFARNHPGKKEGDRIGVNGGLQILWPVHCVQETSGAEFADGLNQEKIEQVFFKGVDPQIDSYSAFFDNAHKRKTGLDAFLKKKGVKSVVLVGVATDYCVLFSALDAKELGYDVSVVADACKAINLNPDDEEKAHALMKQMGIHVVKSTHFS